MSATNRQRAGQNAGQRSGRNTGQKIPQYSKSVSQEQLELLLNMLEEEPEIARGFSQGVPKSQVNTFWGCVADQLNPAGPPVKDATGWKNYWTQYKYGLKKKMAKNKAELRSTGGGPNNAIQLSACEERASEMLNTAAAVDGIEETVAFGVPRAEETTEPEIDIDIDLDDPNGSQVEYHIPMRAKKRTTYDLLQQQINDQAMFYNDLKNVLNEHSKKISDMVHYERQVSKSLQELQKIKQQELDEMKRHNRNMESLQLEKLKLKKAILELQLEAKQRELNAPNHDDDL